uniref:Calmodulin regulated spectrin associated protein family member 2 n=1 Tax=Astyanax mexicanus TaxID=7994 RepID=A0A3B1JG24_ASTMX
MGEAAEAREPRRTFIVPAIKSFDHYDFSRAKISSSLTWLVAKAFGSDSIPAELEDPFYKDQYEQEHLKPPVVSLLLSAELYCRAGSLILRSDAAKPLLGHNGVIQALAQKGLYVTDQERLVTERDLCKTPIQMSSHLAMIDTLMMAYTVEMISVERVLSCVQKYSPFFPEEDFPYDAEEAVTTWINKVNEYLREIMAQDLPARNMIEAKSAGQKTRYKREDSKAQTALCLPLVDNLLKDNTDGCALAALLHFYCPSAVPLEDICVKETMSLADSLYNLQLIQDFCRENLNNCCHFTLEDMLYASSSIKSNYLVFMAELFWWCEVVKPSFVQPRTLETKVSDPIQSTKMAPITKQNLIHRPASPDQQRSQPNATSSTVIKRCNSLSYVDGCVGTWPKEKRYSNGVLPEDHSPQPLTPTMEEALKIIHDSERPHSSLHPPGGDNAFFLHSQDPCDQGAADSNSNQHDPEPDSLSKARADDAEQNSTSTEIDTGIHVRTEDIQDGQDEDSSLKDYSDMDQDYEARSCPLPDTGGGFSPVPSLLGARSLATSSASSIGSASAVRMTSFAEQKFRKLNYGDGRSGGNTPDSEVGTTPSTALLRSITPDARSPGRVTSPRDPSSILVSEMVQLKMKLEEKRRAIEAQKKKVEAAFTRHRQRMGRTAFLNVVRRKGATSPSGGDGGSGGSPDQGGRKNTESHVLKEDPSSSRLERCKPDGAPLRSTPDEGGAAEVADLSEYTRSIERLNTSLSFLQTEMQRLAQQQERIMHLREQQSWVISPPHTHPQTQMQPSPRKHPLRSSSVVGRGSVGSLSPNLSSTGSPRAAQRSPAPIKRKSASFHARTPRTPRPNELKVTPFSRMLNTPQSVDSLPRLRRFSPSQTQTRSFAYLGHDEGPAKEDRTNKEKKATLETKDPEANPDTDKTANGALEKEGEVKEMTEAGSAEKARPVKVTVLSQVQSQPAAESLVVPAETDSEVAEVPGKKDLIEVPLSVLKPSDVGKVPESGMDLVDPDQKMCCGFFYRDDQKGEEDIAQKRAALLEKRLRREKESQMKKQQHEQETEQKKEVARLKAEEECQKKEDEKARREFIKNEYLRKKQLKLMEDMDSVIRPRTPSIKQKKPRPKSMHRDIMESPKPPARSSTGSRPRGFSVSSISLASLNLADNESVQSDKRTSRPESAEGQLSPCPSVSRNGENWENESTTSSAASNTEYTGPKLYKEPSAKSNKYIIQNALAHCCLAGKVNEGQKKKILEEMEKTESNNFLILFRDAGCQFRAIYTYYPETQEISKLAGIGPKSITPKMIENLYKYSSDKKQFCHIPAKTMSASIDAITIYGHLWQTKKQSTPKKLLK